MIDKYTYRIFLTKSKEMCFVHSIHFGTKKVIVSSKWGNTSVPLDGNILMKDTGTRDINNKRIYEGDIVKFKDQITINGSKTHISVVEFNEQFNTYMYHAACMGLYTVNKAQNEKFKIEVIGNIYENFNLLEGENNVE